MNPVGISYQWIIPDNHLTASSQYPGDKYQPANGRLHGRGWCAEEADRNDDWLQVDFGKTVQVCAVATQGDVSGNDWVTDFKLSFSTDGNNWKTIKDRNGSDVVRIVFSSYTKYNNKQQYQMQINILVC